jgi:DNA-directed RNA polymerase subunit RPC12/RpoP
MELSNLERCQICRKEFEPLFKLPFETVAESLGIPSLNKIICPRCGFRIAKELLRVAGEIISLAEELSES